MSFRQGKYYRDSIGRRWKIIGILPDVVLVRRFLRLKLGHLDNEHFITIYLDNGFTTLYDDEYEL